MIEPQLIIEQWITEARGRTLYEGHDIAQRLRRLQEYIGEGDRAEQSYIQDWINRTDESSTYEAGKLIDPLLDLWGFVTQYQSQDA